MGIGATSRLAVYTITIVLCLTGKLHADAPWGGLVRVGAFTGAAVFSGEKYNSDILTQDILDKQNGGMAELAIVFRKRHRFGAYGSLGGVTYECKGQLSFVQRTGTGDQVDQTNQTECSGTYKRLGAKYEYVLSFDAAWNFRFGIGTGYHWQTNNMKVVHTGPRSYDDRTLVRSVEPVRHRREGREIVMLDLGAEMATGPLRIGPTLVVAFDRDEQFRSSDKDVGPTGINHTWFFAGITGSYCGNC